VGTVRPGDLEPQPRGRGRLAVLVRRQPAARPVLPASAERRREHLNATRAVPRPAIDRALSRRDVPLREKTLWRMLYETAARASEVLALNIEDPRLDARRAPIRSKGGDTDGDSSAVAGHAVSAVLGGVAVV
jgi:integrase